MSSLELRIELPAYSHSFNVRVPPTSTIQAVKEEIARVCPGQPRTEGQRLIWRGRILKNDDKVEDLWKSSTDSRTLHLAVHPSAWVTEPPQMQGPPLELEPVQPSSTLSTISTPEPFAAATSPLSFGYGRFPLDYPPTPSTSSPPTSFRPIPYVATKHQDAIRALMTGIPPNQEDTGPLRTAAKAAIERVGWSWPSVFDEHYPPTEPGGLVYRLTSVNGQQYLELVDESQPPTPVQRHALSVLSYTFSLLNLTVTSTITQTQASYTTTSPQVNELLQQLGLPQLRVIQPQGNNQNANVNPNPALPQLREIPLRPLLMPAFLLVFRTILLLYFVAPTRKPIFIILILAWMLYEIWQPLRNGLVRVRVQRVAVNRNGADPQGPENNANNIPAAGVAGGEVRPAVNVQGAIDGLRAGQLDFQAGAVLDTLANMNLQSEEATINQAHLVPVAEPSLGHKVLTFFGLLFSTLHPAIWNRRRTGLRRREGVIRTEANMRREPAPRAPEEEETEEDRRAAQARRDLREQHARRPRWVQEYMARVVAEEWVDDSD